MTHPLRVPLSVLMTLSLAACAPGTADVRLIQVDSSHGTLRFRGTIERLDLGNTLEFRPDIEATFLPDAEINRTSLVQLRRYSLTAISSEGSGQGVEVLYRDDQPIEVRLSGAGETGPLPVVSLRVPRRIVAGAQRLDLSVSDGRILWRIAELE